VKNPGFLVSTQECIIVSAGSAVNDSGSRGLYIAVQHGCIQLDVKLYILEFL
jgi:hypothetical protein